MAVRQSVRNIAPLSVRADVVPSSVNVEDRTVELTWSTGAAVLRGFFDPYWEELSMLPKHVRMDRLKSGRSPMLNAHSAYSNDDVIGVVERAELKSGIGTARVRFAKDEASNAVFSKVADGILTNVSVGYRVYKMEKISDGEGQIPVYRAVDWEPYEISIVPVGADAGATVRAAVTSNACVFEDRTMEHEATPQAAAPSAAPPPAQPVPPPVAAQPSVDVSRAVDMARTAERERVRGIQRVAHALRRPDSEVAEAIDNGVSLDSYRAQAIDAHAAAETIVVEPVASRISAGEDSKDKWMRGVSTWIVHRSGVARDILDAAIKSGSIDKDAGEFRGLSMVDIARQSLERNGVSTKGMVKTDIVGRALTHRGTSATGDFPVLLENALHKVLLTAHAITPDTWSRFCARGSVSDFKKHPRYRMGTFGALSDLNEGGEIVSKAIPDALKESIEAKTKGNNIRITRRALINDDMGAFGQLATMLGRAAKLSIERDVFALLALNSGAGPAMSDGNPLFHASRNNITTAAALSAAALDADRVAMASRLDQSGNEYFDIRPDILLVNTALGGQARIINDSQYDPDASANKAQNKPNVAAKLFRDIIDTPRIAGTRRYVLANPGIAPVFEVAFLDGREEPVMEMGQVISHDGVYWQILFDYAVGAVDTFGAVTNAG